MSATNEILAPPAKLVLESNSPPVEQVEAEV